MTDGIETYLHLTLPTVAVPKPRPLYPFHVVRLLQEQGWPRQTKKSAWSFACTASNCKSWTSAFRTSSWRKRFKCSWGTIATNFRFKKKTLNPMKTCPMWCKILLTIQVNWSDSSLESNKLFRTECWSLTIRVNEGYFFCADVWNAMGGYRGHKCLISNGSIRIRNMPNKRSVYSVKS